MWPANVAIASTAPLAAANPILDRTKLRWKSKKIKGNQAATAIIFRLPKWTMNRSLNSKARAPAKAAKGVMA